MDTIWKNLYHYQSRQALYVLSSNIHFLPHISHLSSKDLYSQKLYGLITNDFKLSTSYDGMCKTGLYYTLVFIVFSKEAFGYTDPACIYSINSQN